MTDHVSATAGSTEQLTCSAVGRPAPQIHWYKDGVPLTVNGRDESVVIDEKRNLVRTTRHLVLRDLMRADSGQYRCTAFSVHGSVSFVYHLVVLGQMITCFLSRT